MTVTYDYLHQPIVASALIEQGYADSFYFPEANGHTGFASDGTWYDDGVPGSPPIYASWFLEGPGPYRGTPASFPSYGLVLLGRASLTILNETVPPLTPWMIFLLGDNYMLTNNFAFYNPNYANWLQGFVPKGLAYANGVISVIYSPDPGAEDILSSPPVAASNMIVNVDFTNDTAYLDIAT